jgi:hypothetical protein
MEDLDDNTPSITSPAEMAVDENAGAGTPIGVVVPVDPDATACVATRSLHGDGRQRVRPVRRRLPTGAVTVKAGAVLIRDGGKLHARNRKR